MGIQSSQHDAIARRIVGSVVNRIRNAANRLKPAPWASSTMEFEYGVWRGVSAANTTGDRQLGEEATRPLYLRKKQQTDWTACKYEGSRNGANINLSALRNAMPHYEETLAVVTACRSLYLRKSSRPSDPLRVLDMYLISKLIIAMTAYSLRCKIPRCADGDIPASLTNTYQFTTGVYMIIRDMIEKADPQAIDNPVISAYELYNYADRNKIFTSPDGNVCAGSTRKIKEFLHVILTGKLLSGASLTQFELNEIVGDKVAWFDYAIRAAELDLYIDHECLKGLTPIDDDEASEFSRRGEILELYLSACHALIDIPPEKRPIASGKPDFHILKEGILWRQSAILKSLGRDTVPEITDGMIVTRTSTLCPYTNRIVWSP